MKVGILYNLVDEIEKGKEIEMLADNEVLQTAQAVKEALSEKGYEAIMIRVSNKGIRGIRKQIKELSSDVDFIFNLAEGIDGDNCAEPKIAAAIKKTGLPYSGSDENALALCLDKVKAKEMLMKNNIPTPNFQVFETADDSLSSELRFPMIIKPVHEDGSIGITTDSIVYDEAELRGKVAEMIELYKQPALVEEFIDGREINASVLGSPKTIIEVLPLSEIAFNFPPGVPRIVSFEAKWIEDSLQYKNTVGVCPSNLPIEVSSKIIEHAKRAFRLMGCSNYARVDFRIRDGVPYVLEVNPNPCINPDGAGFIRSANAAGYSYSEIIHKIFEIASKDMPAK